MMGRPSRGSGSCWRRSARSFGTCSGTCRWRTCTSTRNGRWRRPRRRARRAGSRVPHLNGARTDRWWRGTSSTLGRGAACAHWRPRDRGGGKRCAGGRRSAWGQVSGRRYYVWSPRRASRIATAHATSSSRVSAVERTVARMPSNGDSTSNRLCICSGSTLYNGAGVLRLFAQVR
jgi:hypothetical protein